MALIIGMEESQAIANAFRAKGIEAFSCDLQPCSGGHPEWHIQEDIFVILNSFRFYTQNVKEHFVNKWKGAILHPVCTYLTVSNNGSMANGCSLYTAAEAKILRRDAISDFMRCVNCGVERYAIENPIGVMSTEYKQPSQIIHPYNYGHGETKATCLWLRKLPRLNGFNTVEGREGRIWKMPPGPDRTKERSKTFAGIAEAMAIQWAHYFKD